jgi:carbonyl reductase 1
MALRTILVTGGNKGIGRAICERLLTEWDDTQVIMACRSKERGQSAMEDILKKTDCAKDRLKLVELDVSSEEASVKKAVEELGPDLKLYGLLNNAGIMSRDGAFSAEEVFATNYWGIRRVCEAFGPKVEKRIVNMGSAGGANFVSRLEEEDPIWIKLAKPWTLNDIDELDAIAKKLASDETHQQSSYQASKACVHALTFLLARKVYPNLIINAVTPGWIKSDMTQGTAAKGTPEQGAVPPCWAMMDSFLETQPTGRYYGSDCVRSPLDVYRGPGEPPFVSDEDLELQKTK